MGIGKEVGDVAILTTSHMLHVTITHATYSTFGNGENPSSYPNIHEIIETLDPNTNPIAIGGKMHKT